MPLRSSSSRAGRTSSVHSALVGNATRISVEGLVAKRDERKGTGFAKVIAKAMQTKLGSDADEVLHLALGEERHRPQQRQWRWKSPRSKVGLIFALVDALTPNRW